MFCIHCGYELPDNAKFCMNCGNQVICNIPSVAKEEDSNAKFLQIVRNTILFIYDKIESEGEKYPYFRVYINGKVGLLDNTAKPIVPCLYDKTVNYYYNSDIKEFAYSEVQLNGKWGFYQDDKEIIPCTYDSVTRKTEHDYTYYLVQKDDKFGILDYRTWKFTEYKYDKIEIFDKGLFYVWENGKQGVLKNVEELISCKYDSVERETEHNYTYYLTRQDSKYGIIEERNGKSAECKYDKIEIFDKGLFYVWENGKQGVLNVTNEVIPCKYDSVERKSEYNYTYYLVQKDDKFGVIEIRTWKSTECKYDEITFVDKGLFYVWENGKQGVLNEEEELLPCKYESIQTIEIADGIGYKVKLNRKCGIFNSSGQLLNDFQQFVYDNVESLGKSRDRVIISDTSWIDYIISKDDKKGIVRCYHSSNGNCYQTRQIVDCKYDAFAIIDRIRYTLKFQLNGYWGIASIKGGTYQYMVKPIYKEIQQVGNWHYIIKNNGLYGVLFLQDRNESWEIKELLACKYDEIKAMHGCTYIVTKGSCQGVYSVDYYPGDNVKEIVPLNYESVEDGGSGIFKVRLNSKYGYLGKDVPIPCQYDDVKRLGRSHFLVQQNGKWGIHGLTPCQYDDVKQLGDVHYIFELNGKYGYFHGNSSLVILPKCCYEEIRLERYRAVGFIGNKCGFARSGDCQYDEIKAIGERFKVRMGTKWGLHHKWFSCEYDRIDYDDKNEKFIFEKNGCVRNVSKIDLYNMLSTAEKQEKFIHII